MLKKHSDIIQDNLSILVENTDLNRVVPILERKHVLSRDIIVRILNPAHDVKQQTTNLYAALIKRGPRAYAELRDALQESNHVDLANLLRMNAQETFQVVRSPSLNSVGSGQSLNSDSDVVVDHEAESTDRLRLVGDHRSSDQTYEPNSNSSNSFSAPPAPDPSPKHSEPSCTSNSRPTKQSAVPFQLPVYYRGLEPFINGADLSPNEDVNIRTEENLPVRVVSSTSWSHGPLHYKMNSYPRGCALVVNNVDFHDNESFPRRNGAENDMRRLKDLLEQLYFEVDFHENLTMMQMSKIVEDFSRKEELATVDSAVVVFMSHGAEGASEEDTEIVGVDGIGLKTRKIVGFFSNDRCRALIHKPKVFFFQACRGILKDPGVLLDNYYRSSRTEIDGRKIVSSNAPVRMRSVSDVFIAYAVPPGRPANRDRFNGTWFIQTLIDIFANNAWKYDLEDMLKMVDNRIKNLDNCEVRNFQAVATTTIGWNKKLFFNPGLILSKPGETAKVVVPQTEDNNEGMDVVDDCRGRQETRDRAVPEEDESSRCALQTCFPISKCIMS